MNLKKIEVKIFIIFIAACVFISCKSTNESTPKPYGYFRIAMPENTYQQFNNDKFPYTFEYSSIAVIEERIDRPEQKWLNIVYPQHNAIIYITHHNIKNNLDTIINDSHNFTYRHTVKADAIEEITYFFPERNVFCLYAQVEGDAASPIQFLLTDSVHNFVRGSLYFNAEPNSDSVAPVVDFIKKDIMTLMNSLEWKHNK